MFEYSYVLARCLRGDAVEKGFCEMKKPVREQAFEVFELIAIL